MADECFPTASLAGTLPADIVDHRHIAAAADLRQGSVWESRLPGEGAMRRIIFVLALAGLVIGGARSKRRTRETRGGRYGDSRRDYGHEDLQANMWKDSNGKHGHDYVNNDDDPMDDQGHGTHCSRTIAAVGNNDTGLGGVNWRAKIMALKFLDKNGSGSNSNAIKCIDDAVKNGAKVLNNSWGGGGFSPENIVAVMAINGDGERPTFSCFGAESVDLGATPQTPLFPVAQ